MSKINFSEFDKWNKEKVLITGGAGFIGSNLARRIVDLGGEVTIVDSLIPDYGGNLFNLNGYESKLNINFSDIRDKYSMEYLLKNKSIIFNLAGQTSHLDSMLNPHNDLEINCIAQLSLLESCRKVNPSARIIFTSTRQIYGKPNYLPVNENHKINPVDINGIHKLSTELYLKLYNQIYGLRTSILRLTNTIGPRMRIKDARQTFLGIWIKNLIQGTPLEVWGGNQIRDFNDVDDVVDALIICAKNQNLLSTPYNLGSNELIKLSDLAKTMIQIYGKGEIKYMEYPKVRKKIDIGDYYSCYTKFNSETGWEPKNNLVYTLEKTLNYYSKNFKFYK